MIRRYWLVALLQELGIDNSQVDALLERSANEK
jgi:hypothetical protein